MGKSLILSEPNNIRFPKRMFDPQTAIDMIDYGDSIAQKRPPLGAELQVALSLIPAHTWYAVLSGALTYLNERGSDYLGLPKDHPIRLGIETGAAYQHLMTEAPNRDQ